MAKASTNLEPLLVSSDEAARLLGIGHALFYKMKSDGRLGPVPICLGATRKLYIVEELKRYVRNGCPSREVWQRMKDEQKIEHRT